MANFHRKLLPEQYFNQTIVSTDCDPNIPYNNCDYVSITNNDNNDSTHISPYLIVIVALIASAILFISYYLIIIRYCARLRAPIVTNEVNVERDFVNQDQEGDIDHPIWYIDSIGLQPAVINSIKVFKFKKGVGLVKCMDCSVCLSEFEDDESLRLLPTCNHAFHIRCIDTWLRSHTNCPLCRAAIVFNNTNTIMQPNDQNRLLGFGLNQITQARDEENNGEMILNDVQEFEIEEQGSGIQELKQEVETMIAIRRSFSMNSAPESVLMNTNLSNSYIELESLNHGSRTRRMIMMVRSFSYGAR